MDGINLLQQCIEQGNNSEARSSIMQEMKKLQQNLFHLLQNEESMRDFMYEILEDPHIFLHFTFNEHISILKLAERDKAESSSSSDNELNGLKTSLPLEFKNDRTALLRFGSEKKASNLSRKEKFGSQIDWCEHISSIYILQQFQKKMKKDGTR